METIVGYRVASTTIVYGYNNNYCCIWTQPCLCSIVRDNNLVWAQSNGHNYVLAQLCRISVSLIQAGLKPPLRVAASLFCTYWLFQPYTYVIKHISDKGTPPPCRIDSFKPCPTPALQPLFVPTGWLHFFSWIPSPYLFPPCILGYLVEIYWNITIIHSFNRMMRCSFQRVFSEE